MIAVGMPDDLDTKGGSTLNGQTTGPLIGTLNPL